MIQLVYEQSLHSTSLNDLVVATDNKSINDTIQSINGNVFLSLKTHQNGTSRCAEYAEHITSRKKSTLTSDYIVNIQGDEPLINPKQIDELTDLFNDKNVTIATQVKKETNLSLLENRNIVKATLDLNNYASNFSRKIDDKSELEKINQQGFFYKHIGIYGFRIDILMKLTNLNPTKNEINQHLEQLRWLDHGYKIKTGITTYESISVDTPEDLILVENCILRDKHL